MNLLRPAAALLVASALAAPAFALNILIVNDDGCEASTVYALQQTLIAAGHKAIICASTQNNSGVGAKFDFIVPFTPMTSASQAGMIPAGSPGTGSIAGYPTIFYVNGTPVDCVYYGIDIAASSAWGSGVWPDLVISGPNYGVNLGWMLHSSGTFNAAEAAINRGIPALAVSATTPASFKAFTKLASTDPEFEDAALILKLVNALVANKALAGGSLLPATTGLNINIPTFATGQSGQLPWKIAQVGTATTMNVTPRFVSNLGADPIAHQYGVPTSVAFPGITAVIPSEPVPAGFPVVNDTDPASEANLLATNCITVSVIRGNTQANRAPEAAVRVKLLGLAQ